MKRQRGFALGLVLALLIGAGLWLFGRLASRAASDDGARQLAAARDALLARAVNDANRPGSLPCPDHPGNADGNAELFAGNACPTYLGLLPWRTLDLPPPADGRGDPPWYLLAPGLRDHDSAEPINDTSAGGLALPGDPAGVAALLILPGPPLPGQQRPSPRAADYLEGQFADGRYTASPTGNDRWLALTRRDLWAAVDQRVAGEVRACLLAHASASGSFPWPAPFATDGQRGQAGSRFGRLPASQPDAGAQARLNEAGERLAAFLDQLAMLGGSAQLAALGRLGEEFAYLRNLAEAIAATASPLNGAAAQLAGAARALLATPGDNLAQSRFASARSQLVAALADNGFDPLARTYALLAGGLANGSIAPATAADWLTLADSQHPAIVPALHAAREIAAATLGGDLQASAQLAPALRQLLAATVSSRPPVRAADLAEAAAALGRSPPDSPPGAFLATLDNALARLAGSGSPASASAALARASLAPLSGAAGRAPRDAALVALHELAGQLDDLERFDANLTRSSLNALAGLPAAEAARRAAGLAAALGEQASSVGRLATGSDDALFNRASLAWAGITGKKQAQALLQAALDNPDAANRSKAADAIAQTRAQGEATLLALRRLADELPAGPAAAFPIVWHSARCDFLRSGGWWQRNAWADALFYQFAERHPALPGTLRVNGRGSHRLLVVAGGPPLAGQSRPGRQLADYLESGNADPSRDAPASAPGADFRQPPPGPAGNDRLAHD